ncbi:MAG: hypothetical protein WBV81_06970 [Ignavibacteriaceae bacterium]
MEDYFEHVAGFVIEKAYLFLSLVTNLPNKEMHIRLFGDIYHAPGSSHINALLI